MTTKRFLKYLLLKSNKSNHRFEIIFIVKSTFIFSSLFWFVIFFLLVIFQHSHKTGRVIAEIAPEKEIFKMKKKYLK